MTTRTRARDSGRQGRRRCAFAAFALALALVEACAAGPARYRIARPELERLARVDPARRGERVEVVQIVDGVEPEASPSDDGPPARTDVAAAAPLHPPPPPPPPPPREVPARPCDRAAVADGGSDEAAASNDALAAGVAAAPAQAVVSGVRAGASAGARVGAAAGGNSAGLGALGGVAGGVLAVLTFVWPPTQFAWIGVNSFVVTAAAVNDARTYEGRARLASDHALCLRGSGAPFAVRLADLTPALAARAVDAVVVEAPGRPVVRAGRLPLERRGAVFQWALSAASVPGTAGAPRAPGLGAWTSVGTAPDDVVAAVVTMGAYAAPHARGTALFGTLGAELQVMPSRELGVYGGLGLATHCREALACSVGGYGEGGAQGVLPFTTRLALLVRVGAFATGYLERGGGAPGFGGRASVGITVH